MKASNIFPLATFFAIFVLCLHIGSLNGASCDQCPAYDECDLINAKVENGYLICEFECEGGITSTCRIPLGGGVCFLPGTLVNTKDGLKPIEKVKVGDEVLSLKKDKNLRYNRVLFTYQAQESGYYVINGTIKVTGSHPFLVNGKWTRVEDITPGDKLLGKDLKPVVVQSIVRVDKPVRVYNFEVENAHNFFVHDILVHNNKQP